MEVTNMEAVEGDKEAYTQWWHRICRIYRHRGLCFSVITKKGKVTSAKAFVGMKEVGQWLKS